MPRIISQRLHLSTLWKSKYLVEALHIHNTKLFFMAVPQPSNFWFGLSENMHSQSPRTQNNILLKVYQIQGNKYIITWLHRNSLFIQYYYVYRKLLLWKWSWKVIADDLKGKILPLTWRLKNNYYFTMAPFPSFI